MKKLLLLFLVSSIASLTAGGTCPVLKGYTIRHERRDRKGLFLLCEYRQTPYANEK